MKKMPVKKKVGVKKLENRPKSGREIVFLPVKKSKKWQKTAFTGTFFSREKKNTEPGPLPWRKRGKKCKSMHHRLGATSLMYRRPPLRPSTVDWGHFFSTTNFEMLNATTESSRLCGCFSSVFFCPHPPWKTGITKFA